MVRHVVILAGGSGTRLWPASRKSTPKQFLDLGRGKSLFQETLARTLALDIEGMIIIVTHQDHCEEVARQWQSMAEKTAGKCVVLPEPFGCNTAPALVYASTFLRSMNEEASTLSVLPSDHTVSPLSVFKENIEKAHLLADQGFLVSFGIPPRGPATGYGYLETGKHCPPGFQIKTFHEKPDPDTAQKYFSSGNFYWNSGMFTYRSDIFLDEIGRHSPETGAPFSNLKIDLKKNGPVYIPDSMNSLKSIYDKLSPISIDYALMEKSDRAAMVPAGFDWSDVGSWDEVSRYFNNDASDIFKAEADGNYIYSDIPVGLANVQDLIVVIKNGTALICKKGSSQLVRNIVGAIEAAERKDLL